MCSTRPAVRVPPRVAPTWGRAPAATRARTSSSRPTPSTPAVAATEAARSVRAFRVFIAHYSLAPLSAVVCARGVGGLSLAACLSVGLWRRLFASRLLHPRVVCFALFRPLRAPCVAWAGPVARGVLAANPPLRAVAGRVRARGQLPSSLLCLPPHCRADVVVPGRPPCTPRPTATATTPCPSSGKAATGTAFAEP